MHEIITETKTFFCKNNYYDWGLVEYHDESTNQPKYIIQ